MGDNAASLAVRESLQQVGTRRMRYAKNDVRTTDGRLLVVKEFFAALVTVGILRKDEIIDGEHNRLAERTPVEGVCEVVIARVNDIK